MQDVLRPNGVDGVEARLKLVHYNPRPAVGFLWGGKDELFHPISGLHHRAVGAEAY